MPLARFPNFEAWIVALIGRSLLNWGCSLSIKQYITIILFRSLRWWRTTNGFIVSLFVHLFYMYFYLVAAGLWPDFLWTPLLKKCQYSEIFRSVSSPHSDCIRRDMEYLSVFSPNAGKYGPEKLRIWTVFTQCAAFWGVPLILILVRNGATYLNPSAY